MNKLFKRSFALICIALFISFWITSCEAPRNNPVDPENPSNAANAVIEGTVQSFSVPYTPLPEVSVYWPNGNVLVKTDTRGRFSISGIRKTEGILIFDKPGFRTDTVHVMWDNSSKLNFTINLNKLPVLDSIAIYTSVINNANQPTQTFELFITSKITDDDKDIDSVYVKNTQLGLTKFLDYNITERTYQTSLTAEELKVSDLEETIGLDFRIYVKDIFEKEHFLGNGKVTRVIKNQIQIISPSGNQAADSIPFFQWSRFNPGYPFRYMLEVYTNDLANAQLVFRRINITSDADTYLHDSALAPRDYYWVLWVIDHYQNRARSRPAIFVVQ
jgi:hypothetical protein